MHPMYQHYQQQRMKQHPASSPTYVPGQNPTKVPECHEECAEEECDPDACGDENRPPKDDQQVCGIDTRPLLPFGLSSASIVAAVGMLAVILPLWGREVFTAIPLFVVFGVLYLVTFGCMAYCTVCDPGELRRNQQSYGADPTMPMRAHKTWLYKLPIRRYDHYCRWLCNCIGLLNHREFVTMCIGLVTIGFFGAIVDMVLFIVTVMEWEWVSKICILLHTFYSMVILFLAGPILKIHIGLISRNELAAEWKRNDFYVIKREGESKVIPVNDLSDDEFNTRFDAFMYDRKRNPYDKGIVNNCATFWCVSRWSSDQLGDF